MRKKRYYLDTSVWVGVDDRKVDIYTKMFFNKVLTEGVVCLYSKIVDREMINKSQFARDFFYIIWPDELKEKVGITAEVEKLADTYISQGVVGKTSRKDCIHIAAATVYEADMLVSWNFRHIVREHMVSGYNHVNMGLGYKMLEIHSPMEVLDYDGSA